MNRDEPITMDVFANTNWTYDIDYINQLRVERLMAKEYLG